MQKPVHLTPREKEVLVYLKKALSDKEIAVELGMNVRAVKHHVAQLRKKFGFHSRRQFLLD
jgi:DNA-binding CsgD family transcriptional regulator